MSLQHDMRANEAYGMWCRRQFAENPDRTTADEGVSSFRAFMDGWSYRYEAAARTLAHADADDAIIVDELKRLRKDYDEAQDKLTNLWRSNRMLHDMATRQGETIKEQGLNPDDVPAFRRISGQRKEIKRLTRENQRLKGVIVEMEDPAAVGFPKEVKDND